MKVAIIGAGICGLYLARKLSERGETVKVFEKKEKIGKEICSGLFSSRILDFFPESRDLVQGQIDYTLINFPRKTLKVNFSREFLLMRHEELDRLASNLAEKAGAQIILNQKISHVPEGFDRIIGCDGALSDVRRGAGLRDPEFFSALQGFVSKNDSSNSEFLSPKAKEEKSGCSSNYVETWATKSGFIWRIPRGGETEWGIMEKPETAKLVFDDFLRKNNVNLSNVRAWLIPQGFVMPVSSNLALVGDAAGLCKPWSGGGVIWGLTACDILLKKFPDFVRYREEARKFFLPKIILSKIAKRAIYFFGRNLPWLLPQNYKIEGDFLSLAKR